MLSRQPNGELAENEIIIGFVCVNDTVDYIGLRNFRGLLILEFTMNLEIWICCFSVSN